jgi:hypothetical protein
MDCIRCSVQPVDVPNVLIKAVRGTSLGSFAHPLRQIARNATRSPMLADSVVRKRKKKMNKHKYKKRIRLLRNKK